MHAPACLAGASAESAPCVQGELQTYLPASVLASLSMLRELELSDLGLEEDHLPVPWMACLTQLTCLKMGGNQFSCVPASLKALPQLEVLGLTCNPLLQLSSQDVDTLHAIRCLETLMLGKVVAGKGVPRGCRDPATGIILLWSEKSVQAMFELKEMRPRLRVQF